MHNGLVYRIQKFYTEYQLETIQDYICTYYADPASSNADFRKHLEIMSQCTSITLDNHFDSAHIPILEIVLKKKKKKFYRFTADR